MPRGGFTASSAQRSLDTRLAEATLLTPGSAQTRFDDMDDDLDPAFIDLDVSSSGQPFTSSSLGAALDSSLDLSEHGNDGDAGSPHTRLPAHALDLDLELELQLGSSPDGDARGDSNELFNALHAETHDPLSPSPATPPRRRRGSPATAEVGLGGMSLADELASVARPQRTRDLMRELGLDSDEDEADSAGRGTPDSSERSSEAEEDDRPSSGLRDLSAELGSLAARAPYDSGRAWTGSPRPSTSSLGRTPRTRPSTTSLASMSASLTTPEDPDAEEDEQAAQQEQQQEVDAVLQDTATSLQQSMESVGTFLTHLKQHITVGADSRASTSLPATIPDESEPARESLQGSGAPSSFTEDYADRQHIAEAHASTLVRRLYDLAKQRETQLRELGEMERLFGRTDLSWRAALAELEPLELSDIEDEHERREDAVDEDAQTEPRPDLPPRTRRTASPGAHARTPPPVAGAENISSTHCASNVSATLSRAQHDLGALRTLTSSLLSTLSSISDLAQVQSAIASDTGRKLRALKTQASAIRDELGTVERSEAFVRAYEARQPNEVKRTAGESCAADRARSEVEQVRYRLEEGWKMAQRMLAPPV